MKVTQKMIAEGWTRNEDSVWVAPSEATTKALKERMLLSETTTKALKERVLLSEGHHDLSEPLGPGWVRVPIKSDQRRGLEEAFEGLGLTPDEAKLAADFEHIRNRG
jgi:hypothetical protein